MGSNPTVTAMETPEKSGVFPYEGRGVAHFWCMFRVSDAHQRRRFLPGELSPQADPRPMRSRRSSSALEIIEQALRH